MSDKVTIRYEPRNTKHPYTVRWFGDFNLDTGNRSRPSKGFATEAEAEVFRAELIMKFSKGARRDPPDKMSWLHLAGILSALKRKRFPPMR